MASQLASHANCLKISWVTVSRIRSRRCFAEGVHSRRRSKQSFIHSCSAAPAEQRMDCWQSPSMRPAIHATGSSFPSDEPELIAGDNFERRAANLLTDLLAEGSPDILSLNWTHCLLETFLLCFEEFRGLLLGPGAAATARPPLDRLVADFFDRAIKALDIFNAVRDGLDLVRECRRHVAMATAALTTSAGPDPAAPLGKAQIRRAHKALSDLTVLLLDDRYSGVGVAGQSNRRFGGYNKDARAHEHGPDTTSRSSSIGGSSDSGFGSHLSSLSWSTMSHRQSSSGWSSDSGYGSHLRSPSWSTSMPPGPAWSAARQLQAIGGALSVPRPQYIAATGGLASAVYAMDVLLFIVAFALVAAIPCQGRGLPPLREDLPGNFPWSGPVTTLYKRILEESKKTERKNSCGLLKEIHQIELCSTHLMAIADDAAEFVLPDEKDAQELVQIYQSLMDGIDPLERLVRKMFHRIVHTRTEILDCLRKPIIHTETSVTTTTVPTQTGMQVRHSAFRKMQDSEKNLAALLRGPKWKYKKQASSPVSEVVDQVESINMSAAPPQAQQVSAAKGPMESSTTEVSSPVGEVVDQDESRNMSAAPPQLQQVSVAKGPMEISTTEVSSPVAKVQDQDELMNMSAAPPQLQQVSVAKGPRESSTIEVSSPVDKVVDQVESMNMSAAPPQPQQVSVVEGPKETTIEVMMNSSQDSMLAPVSSSLGAMVSLIRKLSLVLAPKYPLRSSLKHAIKLLEEDLEGIRDALMEQSMIGVPNNKAKFWMEEVRELSYDIEDSIDVMISYTATSAKVRSVHGHRHRVARLKTRRLPNMLKLPTRVARVAKLRTLLWEASERHERYQLGDCGSKFVFSEHSSQIPVVYEVVANIIGIEVPKKELTIRLTSQAEQHLKVLCIVGPAGVGKTTLAKELYRELGGQFECRAFIRLPRNPDISSVLRELISQIQRPKQNSDACSVRGVSDNIRNHLQDKRYFIVIDGLWEAEAWDIIKNALPKVNNCSRVIITGEVNNIAIQCSGYHTVDIFELKPLETQDSEKLFFDRAFSSKDQCPDSLKDVSCRMLKECGGLPLAIVTIAGFFASLRDNLYVWHQLLQCVLSSLEDLSYEDMLKEVLNLCYNNLPQQLQTCLQYLTMYPAGCTILKDDLLKQWTAESFITSTKGNEGVAESYFNDLVKRGMIQPEKINHNNEVLSCTVHHIVLDLITHKSREENFITAVDYSQNIAIFFMKARRLSLHYSCAQYATKPEGIRVSQVRSLAFFGLPRCMLSVTECKLLRVLILKFLGNKDDCTSIDLSRICQLRLLRYLKVSSHIYVELPSEIHGLKFLETLEIDARVSAVPNDIVHIPGLLHLSLQDGTKLPDRIGLITSLQTLTCFDLGYNSEDNVQSLGELINLRDLHLTCSKEVSHEHLKRKLTALTSSLGRLVNLKSLTLARGSVSMTMFVDHSSAIFSTPMFLQRLELPSICIFSRLPEWTGKLHKLCILKIAVRVLLKSDIDILTGLPDLTVLSLYVRRPNVESVIFNNGALPVLKYFKYRCSALCIGFQEEALPNLGRLKLCFNVHRGEKYSNMISGVEHLLNLKEIAVRIGAAAGVEESNIRAVESAFESTIHKHPRFPIYMDVRRAVLVI